MAPTVFFIGLGNMGWGMAKCLAEKADINKPLLVYNRTKSRATEFADSQPAGRVTVVDSIAAGVAKAGVVMTVLSNDAAVEAVYKEVLGAKPAAGTLLVESSTVHPETTERLAATVAKNGSCDFVAAPVFGAAAMAMNGQLIAVLAGPTAAVDRARPLFVGATARAEILLRDEPVGRAPLLKLVGNTFVVNMVEQLAEGYAFAEASGVGTDALSRFVELMYPGPYTAYSQRMLSGQYCTLPRPLFGVDLARKDLGHALRLAGDAGVRLPNAETADAHLKQVRAHDGETGDIAAIYGVVRQEAGLPYENDAAKKAKKQSSKK